jgi:hypothetical protein
LVIGQSHGYDIGNLVVVAALFLGLLASRRGSLRGQLVAIGALGCLFYSYVTYAFLIVLNPVTPLYIAVLGFGGWSFANGLAGIPDQDAEAFLTGRAARRITGAFLVLIALLFALIWLRQIGGSVLEGQLPSELRAAGWPMNPVWVLDLGFVLPLTALTGIQLLTRVRGGARIAVSLLVFMSLLGLSILAMAVSTLKCSRQARRMVTSRALRVAMCIVMSRPYLATHRVRRPLSISPVRRLDAGTRSS